MKCINLITFAIFYFLYSIVISSRAARKKNFAQFYFSYFFCDNFFSLFFFFFHFFLLYCSFSTPGSQKDTNISFIFRHKDAIGKSKNPISSFSFEMDVGAGKLLFPRKYSITNSAIGTL